MEVGITSFPTAAFFVQFGLPVCHDDDEGEAAADDDDDDDDDEYR
jgi:hypothetical protein